MYPTIILENEERLRLKLCLIGLLLKKHHVQEYDNFIDYYTNILKPGLYFTIEIKII